MDAVALRVQAPGDGRAAESCPKIARKACETRCKCGRVYVNIAQNKMVSKVGQVRAGSDHSRANFGRHRPNLAEYRPQLAEIDPKSVGIAQAGKFRGKFGRCPMNFGNMVDIGWL